VRTSWLRALILVVVLVGGVISPVAPVGDARATPSGFVTVPDANVHEDLPVDQSLPLSKEDLEGSVMVSDNASTTEIVVTTTERANGYLDNGSASRVGGNDGSIALVIQDDTNHAGRQVAVPADAVKAAIGRVPEAVYGTHEDGSEWSSKVRAESGLLIFEVPHFSSNTVTFSGEITLRGSYADGSSVDYSVSSLDSVSNLSINVTGKTSTEWDNVSESAVSADRTRSLSVGGNIEPSGPGATGEPVVEVTDKTDLDYNPMLDNGDSLATMRILTGDTSSDSTVNSELRFEPSSSGSINQMDVRIGTTSGSDYGTTVDVYLVAEGPDQTYGEGTLLTTWDPDWSGTRQTINFDNTTQVSAGTTYTVEFVTSGSDSDGAGDYLQIYLGDQNPSEAWFSSTESGTVSSYADSTLDPTEQALNVSVSDGAGSSASFGDFTEGQTKTAEIGLSTASTELNFSGSGEISYTARLKERSQSVDPSINVNGHTSSYSGALSNGATKTLSANDSWIESSNTVNVSVGDGSLSADAPSPNIRLNYTHEASDMVSINYSSEGWTERYNVSRTYASSQDSPSLIIPYQGDVTAVSSLEEKVDSGSWSSIPSERYSLSGGTLTVQLDDGDGDGDIDAGSEIAVRTTGRYVKPVNGEITVTDPILPGEDADVEFRIDSKSSGFYVDLSGVSNPGVRYTYQESWESVDSHMIVTADGEKRLKLPNAAGGDTSRVTLVPITVALESGDARVSVADPDEPTITMGAGSSSGDDVTITYLEASTGTTYQLYSTSRDRIVDKETADAGTVSFVEDDSAESLMINTSSSGGGGGGMFASESSPADYGVERPVLVMGALAALVIGLVWATGRTGVRGRERWALVSAVSVALGLISLESLYPGAISRRIGEGLGGIFSQVGTVVPIAGIAGVVIVGYVVVSWWQSRKAEASTPETKVTFSLGDKKK